MEANNGLEEGLRRKSLNAKNGNLLGLGEDMLLSMEKRIINTKTRKVKQKLKSPINYKKGRLAII